MIFDLVWTSTLLALRAVGLAQKSGMTPFPAVVTLRNSGVHVGAFESGYISAEIERVVNKSFGLRATL